MNASARPGRRTRVTLEQLEARDVPALFVAGSPQTFGGLNNNGCVAAGDLTGDGIADLVLTNYGTGAPGSNSPGRTLTVLQGGGDGTFTSKATLTVGNDHYVSFVAVADLDADGDQDIVASSSAETEAGFVTVFRNGGTGTFVKGQQVATGGKNTSWVGVAQMTAGDTNLDLMVCSFGSSAGGTVTGNNMTLLTGNGDGTFAAQDPVTNGAAFIPTSGALADFDADGDGDVVVTIPGVPPDQTAPQPEGTVQVFLNNGVGGLDLGNAFGSGGALPISVRTADFDGDGLPDLAVGNAGDPDGANLYAQFGKDSAVGVLMGAGGGNFAAPTSLTVGLGVGGSKSVFAVAPADFDGDGKQDLAAVVYGHPLISTAKARLIVYKGNGDGNFTGATGSPFDSGTTDGQYLAVAPFDANASLDVVLVGAANKVVTLLNQTVLTPPVATTTSLETSDASADYGAGFTLTATVTATTGVPTGSVTFKAGTTTLGTGTLTTVGTLQKATLLVTGTQLAVGSYTLTATYGGATGFTTSTSANLPQTIDPATPTVALTATPAAPTVGDSVTLTATVASTAGTPTGNVSFFDGTTLLDTRPLVGGTVSYATTTLTAGPHTLTAQYAGQGNFAAATSAGVAVTVSPSAPAVTTTTLQTTAASVVYGGAGFTLTAVVSATAGTPAGTVTFLNGTTVLGTADLVTFGAQRRAQLPFTGTALAVGNYTLTARYEGAAGFAASTSAALSQAVTGAPVDVTLTLSPTAPAVGQPLDLTATVSSPAGAVAGDVSFFDGATLLGTDTLAGGVATLTTTALAAGMHTLTARFLAAGNFAGGASTGVPVTVSTGVINPPVQGVVVITATNSPNPAEAGRVVTLTAAVSDFSGIPAEPTGAVTFSVGGTTLGTAPLVNGVATLTTTTLPVGTSTVTYDYPGDANFAGRSGTLSQVVTAAPNPNPNPNPSPNPGTGTPPSALQPALLGYREFAVGAGAGREAAAKFYNPDGSIRFSLDDLFPGSTGGVRVTSADFTGDGVADVVAGTGPGTASQVRVIDGVTRRNLFTTGPFEATFLGGVFVSTGDLTGDGIPDLIISPDEGGGPRVVVYDGSTFTVAANFFGIKDDAFRGGARTATGDVNGDGRVELVVAAGFGGGPRVSTYDGMSIGGGGGPRNLFGDMFLFEQALRNGVYVAVGDVDGDGFADLIGGGGPGGAPRVLGLSGKDLAGGSAAPGELANFFAGSTDNRGGVRVAVKDLDGDTRADLVVGDGVGGGSRVTAYLGKAITQSTLNFEAYPGFDGGVFVG